jgi:hypothetical protein
MILASPGSGTGHELRYFMMLSQSEQCAAIRRMAAIGMSDYTIASATRLSVEQIRQIIGDRATHVTV